MIDAGIPWVVLQQKIMDLRKRSEVSEVRPDLKSGRAEVGRGPIAEEPCLVVERSETGDPHEVSDVERGGGDRCGQSGHHEQNAADQSRPAEPGSPGLSSQ